MYEIKTEEVYADFSKYKEMFDFSNYSTKSNYYDNSNKSVVVKKKDETAGVAIEEFVGLEPKVHLNLVDDNTLHGKPYFLFPYVLKRWSFQKNRGGI